MSRQIKALILIVAAILYGAAAWIAIVTVALLNGIVGKGACASGCGPDPDRATHITADVAAGLFMVGVVFGARWLFAKPRPPSPKA